MCRSKEYTGVVKERNSVCWSNPLGFVLSKESARLSLGNFIYSYIFQTKRIISKDKGKFLIIRLSNSLEVIGLLRVSGTAAFHSTLLVTAQLKSW